jgi:4-hydroxy-tetrahydrodipicolinate synthase
VIAVKEASGNLEQIRKVVEGRPEGFKVFSGNDDQTLPIMEFGGDGIISVASNIAPKQMVGLVEALQAGDLEEAGKRDAELAPLYDACFVESNPIPVKAALAILELCEDCVRLPLAPATIGTRLLLNDVLKELDR